MESIRSASLELIVEPENGCFSIHPLDARFPRLERIRLGSEYIVAGSRIKGLNTSWQTNEVTRTTLTSVEHGALDSLSLGIPANRDGIGFTHSIIGHSTREYLGIPPSRELDHYEEA